MRIIDVHYPGIKRRLVEEALRIFFEIREAPGLKKKPSTSELLDWLKLLMAEDIGPENCVSAIPQADPAAPRGALEKRAGRDAVRKTRLPVAAGRADLNDQASVASSREIVMAIGGARRRSAPLGAGTQGRGPDGGLSQRRGTDP